MGKRVVAAVAVIGLVALVAGVAWTEWDEASMSGVNLVGAGLACLVLATLVVAGYEAAVRLRRHPGG